MHVGSRRSFTWITPDAPERGLALAALALFGRLAAAIGLLFVYDRVAHRGIAAFGLAFALTFLALFTVELVRYAGLNRHARPNRARG